jgi:dTDP-4-dehydrorhamnose reductase
MKVLVTGKEGQVARCLADRAEAYPELTLVFAAREGTQTVLDLAEPKSIEAAVNTVRPSVIVNAAAYTAVDLAEEETELAMQINGKAPFTLAQAAIAVGARIIQISTDYVFDGELDRPYSPSDPVNPISVYGKSKLAGEEAVRTAAPAAHVVIRTAWVYSPYGKNFSNTMLRLAEKLDEISVVDDQIGNPTSAYDIAEGILEICEEWAKGGSAYVGSTIHLVGPDEMTWCGFARKIFADSVAGGGLGCHVNAISTDQYPTRAKRPKNSTLARTLREPSSG